MDMYVVYMDVILCSYVCTCLHWLVDAIVYFAHSVVRMIIIYLVPGCVLWGNINHSNL